MAAPGPRFLIGSDVGGTFTDTVLLDVESGRAWSTKVPTRTRRQEESVLEGVKAALRRAREELGTHASGDARLHHGSTTATNALLERRTARTAFVTNEGFEDVIAIRRQDRPALYDLGATRPDPLVPADLCIGVPQRRGPGGEDWRDTATAPADALRRLTERLHNAQVEAVAIGLLHADLHPEDEARLAAALREALPGAAIAASHEVWPEFREVERFETTIMNASLMPLVTGYLLRLAEAARSALGRTTPVEIMDSAATLRPIGAAGRLPASLLLSGPAGGVRAAQALAARLPADPVVTLDVGGTSTDVAFIAGGAPGLRTQSRIGGYACGFPAIDIHTLGAGGGSVLTHDAGGHLQVGPTSQGARPGPACYGLGGTEPTLTDAFLVAGRIPAALLLAGRMRLDRDAAHRVIERLAGRLRLDAAQTALGAIRIAVASMAAGVHVITSQRGHDPRGAALIAYGGAGGLVAAELAEAVGIDAVAVPLDAGTFSARGMLAAPTVARVARGLDLALGTDETGPVLERAFTAARAALEAEPGAAGGRLQARAAIHYEGQSHELEIPVAAQEAATTIRERFHAAHLHAYGHAHPERSMSVIRLVLERVREPLYGEASTATPAQEPPPGLPATISLLTGEDGDVREVEARFAWRTSLASGQQIPGPLVVADETQTTFVPSGWHVSIHAETGALRLQRAHTGSRPAAALP